MVALLGGAGQPAALASIPLRLTPGQARVIGSRLGPSACASGCLLQAGRSPSLASSYAREAMCRLVDSAWRRRRFKLLANLYGPYLLSGVSLTRVADDLRTLEVRMKLRP